MGILKAIRGGRRGRTASVHGGRIVGLKVWRILGERIGMVSSKTELENWSDAKVQVELGC